MLMHKWLMRNVGVPREQVWHGRLLYVLNLLRNEASRSLVSVLYWCLSWLRLWTSWKIWDVAVIVHGVYASLRLIEVLLVLLVLVE